MSSFSRRRVLAGLAGFAATPAFGNVATSPRPIWRPGLPGAAAAPQVPVDLTAASRALIAQTGLSGQVGFVLADARNGEVLASSDADLPLPPASVTKAITAAYAFDTLGVGHHFTTRILATGPVRNGRLEGDLVLAGGGAPGLSTRDLAALAAALKETGLREVTGRFLVWDGALPHLERIDPEQPAHLGYNPSVSGLNLNYNRVHFDWKRMGSDYIVLMDARDGPLIPPVAHVRMRIADRGAPVYDYAQDPATGREQWSVARGALGGGGARWLPVRNSGLYAADVFETVARSGGLELPQAEPVAVPPPGPVLASLISPDLGEIARGMLRYSTNLTAEVLGLSATVARQGGVQPDGLAASAERMTHWARAQMGMSGTSLLVDHSGLGDGSRVTARDMAALLVRTGPDGALRRVLREIGLKQENGQPEPLRLWAKTGTLNFVSALAGHIVPKSRPPLVFAVFTADLERRAAIPLGDEENPPGSTGWTRRSRRMQFDLVRLWSGVD